ncbi:MAG TPA: molybdopterin cofactor-binding domain-containing protein, partial [Candidatus Elarobacter sp.]|nr:molybdopterin cofactor-binding domain-containing protein [Candidatus Elarobacter sp.]
MISRGDFIATAGAALAIQSAPGGLRPVILSLSKDESASSTSGSPAPEPTLDRLATWLQIGRDGFVDVFTGKVEVGMGVITGFAMVVADELDVPLDRVRLVTGDTARTPDQGGVGGSTSTELGARPLRHAAAYARAVLVAAAAQRLGVPAERLDVRDGVVMVRDDASR